MSETNYQPPARTNPLLRTKLAMPQLRPPLVPRPALLARLEQGAAGKLTLIAAPAGYGKTTLIAQWLAARHKPVAWLSLDAEDNDPVRFWRYVLTACRAFDESLGKTALAQLRAAPPRSFDSILIPFLNEASQLAEPGVLVLEDYHVITSSSIHQSVAFLLDHLPDTVHLVMMTRSEPPLFLARLRAHNQLTELTAPDLRFSPAETQVFLQQILPVSPSAEMVTRLDAQSEGWAAGLRLMALAVEGKRDPAAMEQFLGSLSGGHRHIIEYLTAEVLAAQPEPLQEFLLQTSLFPRLTASLCDAVTGRKDSASLLAQLERGNLFVMPLGDQGWYRYHTLFAEAMRHSARERFGEEGVRTLYARSSVWYEEHRLLEEAIETAFAAQEVSRATALIEQSLDLRSPRELYTFRRWVEQTPQEALHARPTLCFEYAFALLFTSDRYAAATAAQIEPHLRLAEETWRRTGNAPRLGQALALRALVILWQGNFARAFAAARESLQLLAEDDTFWRSSDLIIVGIEESLAGRMEAAQNVLIEARALAGAAQAIQAVLAASGLLADVYVRQGEFDQAQELYQQVQQEAVGSEDMLDDQGTAALGLSTIAYVRNDLDVAEGQATRALDLGTRRANEQLAVQATLMLARVWWARGRTRLAQENLRSLLAQTRQPFLVLQVLADQARLALALGDIEAVHHWHAAATQRAPDLPASLQEHLDLQVARMLIADGKPDAALKLVDRWRADAQQHGRTSSEIETLALKALAYAAQSNKTQAHKALVRALTIAQSRGYMRIFLDEGAKMQWLIADFRLPIEKQAPRLRAYIYRVLSAFSTDVPTSASKSETLATHAGAGVGNSKSKNLFEPLSPQEQRVLRLLAAGLSNPEIARELVVSTNTIKTQVKSIYRKLNVSTREEARAAARELNLS